MHSSDVKRSAKSLVVTQSAIWQNWNPIENLGPVNLADAPVLLTVGPDNYWMFGRYGSPARKDFEPEEAMLEGFDIPLIRAFNRHPVWKNAKPPLGSLYNYPIQGDEFQMMCGYPAPIGIASQIYTEALLPNTVAKVAKEGKSIDDAIKWAIGELEGYMRG